MLNASEAEPKAGDYERVIRRKENAMVMSEEYATPMRLVAGSLGFRFRPRLRVLNISAAGAELDIHPSQPLALLPCDTVDYVEGEIDAAFAHAFAKPFLSPSGRWPFESSSFDVVVTIAGLHHFTHSERAAMYAECRRVLHPEGGVLVAGDVKVGSEQAAFLNGFVDAHTDTGHRGIFFQGKGGHDHRSLCALFPRVTVSDEHYPWNFSSTQHRTAFCKELFRLKCREEEVAAALLRMGAHETLPHLPWTLTYFVAHTQGDSILPQSTEHGFVGRGEYGQSGCW